MFVFDLRIVSNILPNTYIHNTLHTVHTGHIGSLFAIKSVKKDLLLDSFAHQCNRSRA